MCNADVPVRDVILLSITAGWGLHCRTAFLCSSVGLHPCWTNSGTFGIWVVQEVHFFKDNFPSSVQRFVFRSQTDVFIVDELMPGSAFKKKDGGEGHESPAVEMGLHQRKLLWTKDEFKPHFTLDVIFNHLWARQMLLQKKVITKK